MSGRQHWRTSVSIATNGDKQRPIVTFAWCINRWNSRNVALRLIALGYKNVYWYRGGWEAWDAHHLPKHRSRCNSLAPDRCKEWRNLAASSCCELSNTLPDPRGMLFIAYHWNALRQIRCRFRNGCLWQSHTSSARCGTQISHECGVNGSGIWL